MATDPQLLVSVRSIEEADAALAGGAQWIDVKEPARGALGAADARTVRAISKRVGGAVPVSAALGELHGLEDVDIASITASARWVKVGLAHATSTWAYDLRALADAIGPERLIVAAYADGSQVGAPSIDELLEWTITHRAAGLLVDTAVKDGASLFDHVPPGDLQAIAHHARARGLIVALAGSLRAGHLPQVVKLRPDIIAVRGAACASNDRATNVDADRVAELRRLIEAASLEPASSAG